MTPSAVRNKLEVRVRRLSERKPVEERIEALREIVEIAQEYLDELEDR